MLGACSSSSSSASPKYRATIRWTEYGIPHILAADLGSAAFGQGYAFAKGNGCILADQIIKIRSQRSKYFGPGTNNANIDSDFGFLALDLYGRARTALPQQPAQVREMLQGYAAGYNQYLQDGKPLASACAGQPWVVPITEEDIYAHYLDVGLAGLPQFAVPWMGRAQPPLATTTQWISRPLSLPHAKAASNGWAIGADRSDNGRGKLIANPHFPWEGDLRLYESQLTVPGLLNIYGASLMGVAGMLIGFNEDIGWTHTFSASTQTTLYQLALDPANPFRYKYGSDYRDITSRKVSIDVRQQDGSSQTTERTLYSSHYGPLLDLSAMGLKLSWTAERAISFKNSNVFDTTMASQYLAMWTARNLTEFKKAQEQRGNPWANTLYTDKEGNAYFLDSSRVPRLSAAALDAYEQLKQTDFFVQSFAAQDIVLLNGSDPVYEWEATVEPLERAPQLVRRDYVYNANDSYWLANLAEPLTGFSSLYGPVRSPLTPRTHMNMVLVTEGGSNRFSFQDLQVVALSNRGYLAEKLVGAVVQRCQGKTVVSVGGKQVDISQACGVLGSWDKKVDLASVGAHVWREFLGSYTRLELTTAGGLFQDPFDPNRPLDTPSQLVAVPASGIDPVLVKLGEAVLRLQSAGIALDRALGDIQFTRRADRKISVHGGSTYEGVFNVARYEADGMNTTLYPTMARGEVINPLTYLAQDGYVVNYGSSFVMVLEFTDSGPRAEGFLTYGQSSEPTSPNASDQVERFAQKAWRPLRFRDADILADPKLETVVVEAR